MQKNDLNLFKWISIDSIKLSPKNCIFLTKSQLFFDEIDYFVGLFCAGFYLYNKCSEVKNKGGT